MFAEQKLGQRRGASGDRQTVVPWLEGSYPQFFFVVPLADVESFVARYEGIQTRNDYERFTARSGFAAPPPRFGRHRTGSTPKRHASSPNARASWT